MKLASSLADAWYRGDRWLVLLRPIEWLFRCLVWWRRRCFAAGLLPVYRAPVPVVVVGNITVGGTGKTPTVIALVQALQARGIRAGVVSRGYRGNASRQPCTVSATSTASDCGDEAVLVYQRTSCAYVVAASRPAAVRLLLQQFEVDIIIADDGLQHYALARDMEIILYDAQAGFGNGRCLPAGPLREPLARLEEADFLLARGVDLGSSGIEYRSDALINLSTGVSLPPSSEQLAGSVYAVAGLGRPGLFLSMLAAQGFQVESRLFADHHTYCSADFEGLQGKPIIMTEKDAVKCRGMAGPNTWYLKISACLPDEVVESVAALVQKQSLTSGIGSAI